jgi:DNA-directed RNA polymerase specialized sigma24 family protein
LRHITTGLMVFGDGRRQRMLSFAMQTHWPIVDRVARERHQGPGPTAHREAPAGAADLVRETCMRAFRMIAQRRQTGAVKAWVFAIRHPVFVRQTAQPTPMRSEMLDMVLGAAALAGALEEAFGLPPLGRRDG